MGRRVRWNGVAVVVGCALAFVGAGRATSDPTAAGVPPAEGSPELVTETPDPAPTDQEPAPPAHEPGTMYAPDEGAWQWEDLDEGEQAHAEAVQEWAETANGAEVHDAFSAAVATTDALRRVEQAQRITGLDGIETLGVQ